MSKWYLVLVSIGFLIIMLSETSENKMIMIISGILICGIGFTSYLKSQKKEENK